MQTVKPFVALFVALCVLLPCVANAQDGAESGSVPLSVASGAPERSLTTRFTYTATIPVPTGGTKAVDVWLPIPSDSVWQTVSGLEVDSPAGYAITRESKYGNRMVYVHQDGPQSASLVVTVRFTVNRREVRVAGTPGASARMTRMPSPRSALAPDRLVPVAGRFKTIARQTAARSRTGDRGAMRAIFDSVVATTHYDYKKTSPEYAQGDAAFVCDYKSGNCSDLHSYMISLLRSDGIPAVLEFGFPLTGIPLPAGGEAPTDGTIPGYHCWTWAYSAASKRWMPLDAADGRRWLDFGHPEVENYLFGDLVLERSAVAMSRGRDIVLVPAQKSAPLNYFIYPYAEADGQPVSAVWTLSYHIMER